MKTNTGGVAKLPPPDNMPRFLKRIRELAPPWLFPNDAASVEAGSLSYSELAPGEDGYVQTFLLAQLGLGVGELVAELRALRKEVVGLRSDVRGSARAIIRRLADGSPGNFGGDDDGDAGDDEDGDARGGDFGDDEEGAGGEGEDDDGEDDEGDFGDDEQESADEASEVIDAEVEEIPAEETSPPAAVTSASKPKPARKRKAKAGGGEA